MWNKLTRNKQRKLKINRLAGLTTESLLLFVIRTPFASLGSLLSLARPSFLLSRASYTGELSFVFSFPSTTRRSIVLLLMFLFRWGFRKVNVSFNDKGEQVVVFSNENFQRSDVSRLSKMQSITAAKIRNQLAIKTAPRKEPPPESASIGLLENVSDPPSAIDQLLRERFPLPATAAASFANSSLLQYRQEREQELLRNRSLLATQLCNTRYPTSNILGLEDASLLVRQQAVLDRYRQSPTALTTRGGAGQSSPGRVSLPARSQLENLRLLEALDRHHAGGINSLFNDSSFEQLLLQRQLRAVQSPTVELASNMQALDALLRREDESNRLNLNLRSVYLQRLENRTGGNVDPHYLAAWEALLQQQNNNR
jgi:hypothetical protein